MPAEPCPAPDSTICDPLSIFAPVKMPPPLLTVTLPPLPPPPPLPPVALASAPPLVESEPEMAKPPLPPPPPTD
jgi:hypothetical protein